MRKRSKTSLDTAIVDVWQREVGHLSTRTFAHRFGASEDLVLHLDIFRKLEKHKGCVNTVSFNESGDILVSGSDDKKVILWDWVNGDLKLSFSSGHSNNVFQAKIMPFTQDRGIVTCAADGQVRHALISEDGNVKTKMLAKHRGRAHKLAIEPGSPHIFYTCGEDGMVQHFDLRMGAATELFTCHAVQNRSHMPVIRLNTIAIDPTNPNLFAIAGSDEYTRLYDIRKFKWDESSDFGQPANFFCPSHLIGDEEVGITGVAFSDQGELLVSYNDEFIYLFQKDMGIDPAQASSLESNCHSGESPSDLDADLKCGPQVYKGHENCATVKGVSFFGPKCEYVVSGSDCGRIFIWRKKDGELIRVMGADNHVVNCIESHPYKIAIASSGIDKDIKIWTPSSIDRATLPTNIEKVLVPRGIYLFPFGDDDDDYSDDYSSNYDNEEDDHCSDDDSNDDDSDASSDDDNSDDVEDDEDDNCDDNDDNDVDSSELGDYVDGDGEFCNDLDNSD